MPLRFRNTLFKLLVSLFAAGVLTLLFGDGPRPDKPIRGQAITVDARALSIPAGSVDIPTALSLKLVDGWELTSKARQFGSLSAVYASGDIFTFVADSGAMVRLTRQQKGKPWLGSLMPLPVTCTTAGGKGDRDTESIVADPKTGTFWVGMEVQNAVCRVASAAQGGTRLYQPAMMKDWPSTGGPEAMVRLSSGGFLVFAERPRDSGPVADLLHFDRDPTDPAAKVTPMHYRPPTGYRPVDAAQLPDGRILVLNRRFQLPFTFSARLSIMAAPAATRGKIWGGPIVARLDGDVLGENFEALSVDNDGENLTIWIASDDNQLSIQRTLLLRFIWPGAARPARGVEQAQKPR